MTESLSNNFEGGHIRSFDKLRTSGSFPLMVSLSNHGTGLLDRF